MKASGRIFLDSINHIPGRLADFPKTFGFTELKKGYFPHYFNTPENQNYVGPIPDIKYYTVQARCLAEEGTSFWNGISLRLTATLFLTSQRRLELTAGQM